MGCKSVFYYRRILATRRKEAHEFTRITTVSGNQIVSTLEHRYYKNQSGYREAHLLRCGDRFTTCGVKGQHPLQSVWCGKRRARIFLQTLLPAIQKIVCHFRMHPLQKALRKGTLRIHEGCQKRPKGFLLLKGMFRQSPCSKKFKAVSRLWRKKSQGQQAMCRMYSQKEKDKKAKTYRLSRMRNYFSTQKSQNSLLFKRLCRQSSFHTDDRRRQFQVQRWNQLWEMVQRNAFDYFGERFFSLCCMFRGRENYHFSAAGEGSYSYQSDRASYRRGCKKQSSRQSNHALQVLPYGPSQVGSDTVSTVENFSGRTEPVYDIQVEGTSNFFANKILVHNCLIIDDHIKNRKEANSQTYRDRI
ncbi:hypothetical protein [Peribacillus frigoritolerans]|uniref:hypothetical protein n=1 Tax=Peribacillus castrilensis TaxID=2897690 RepID=UPI00384FE9E2